MIGVACALPLRGRIGSLKHSLAVCLPINSSLLRGILLLVSFSFRLFLRLVHRTLAESALAPVEIAVPFLFNRLFKLFVRLCLDGLRVLQFLNQLKFKQLHLHHFLLLVRYGLFFLLNLLLDDDALVSYLFYFHIVPLI